MRWLAVMVAMAGPAHAEDWKSLSGNEIAAALAGRTLLYPGGQVQDFRANGRTLYQNGARSEWGYWRVEGDLYCSQWPPREAWGCYAVAVTGPDVRFTSETGSESVGRYGDLQ